MSELYWLYNLTHMGRWWRRGLGVNEDSKGSTTATSMKMENALQKCSQRKGSWSSEAMPSPEVMLSPEKESFPGRQCWQHCGGCCAVPRQVTYPLDITSHIFKIFGF